MRVAQSLRALGVHAHDRPVWRRFRRNLSISLGGSALSLAIRLGQTALLTRMLTIDDFGRVLIVLNLFFFLESFVGLRVSDVMYRFFEPLRGRDARAFQGLLLLCLGLSLATGLLVGGGALVASPWAAAHFYRDPQLAPLLKIYGCTVLVSAFRDFYEAVLRLEDRFSSVVVPQVAGALLTLLLLAAYFATARGYDLRTVMATYAVGGFVQTVPALVLALRLLRPSLSHLSVKRAAHALARYRPEMLRCLFHSNLSGYLRFALNPGDVFLLGLISTPAQVALYGLARQLTAPLAHLQTNAQTAVTPEVMRLVAERKFAQLRRLVRRYVATATALGAAAIAGGLLLGRAFIALLARPGYLASLDTVAKTLHDDVNAAYGGTFFSGSTAATLGTGIPAASAITAGTGTGAASNDIAAAIAALRDTSAATSQYGALVRQIGADAQNATNAQAIAQSAVDAAEDRRQNVSGVSLDEEMANMLRFQRGYQASARAMSSIDDMLDTLINRAGRVGL